ncbi:hypothetical protein GXW84_30810 [Rhodococcus sp. IEGM 248]|nr:hypothetical protein [Rhodococcus sp. IEGM 248]
MTHPDDDILDLATLWAPIGGPTPDRIRDLFHIEVDDYRRRLLNAIRFHRGRLPERARADLEHVYGSSILTELDETQRTNTPPPPDDSPACALIWLPRIVARLRTPTYAGTAGSIPGQLSD